MSCKGRGKVKPNHRNKVYEGIILQILHVIYCIIKTSSMHCLDCKITESPILNCFEKYILKKNAILVILAIEYQSKIKKLFSIPQSRMIGDNSNTKGHTSTM